MSSSKNHIKDICETSILLALAIALKYLSALIPFLNLANGGSIDIAMLPIIVIGLRLGPKYSFVGAVLFGLVPWLLKGCKVYSDSPFLEVMLDRVLAYGAYGISGFFFKKRESIPFVTICIVLAAVLRLAFSTASGVILFETYAPEGQNVFWYSLGYNASYILITMAICIVLYVCTKRILFYNAKPIEKIN